MPRTDVSLLEFSNSGIRNEVRRRLIEVFLNEEPGTGRGDNASRYDYIVANLDAGQRVILRRPARKKEGFDFRITVEGINFNEGGRYRDYPKHDDIINDLELKRNANPENYELLFSLIARIFNCEDIPREDYENLTFNVGYDVDLILQVIKFFFIEQDIRYWNYSGRNLLMSYIPRPNNNRI